VCPAHVKYPAHVKHCHAVQSRRAPAIAEHSAPAVRTRGLHRGRGDPEAQSIVDGDPGEAEFGEEAEEAEVHHVIQARGNHLGQPVNDLQANRAVRHAARGGLRMRGLRRLSS
jgi:hypothetical protein